MNQNRVDELKQNLNNDVYKKMDALERLREDTLTSTEKLVDILDGYMSKLDDFEIEEEITTMEVVSDDEVDIEVNDDDMLREYNEKIHDFSLETLTELLAKGDVEQEQKETENVEFTEKDIDTIIDEIDDYKTQELENNEEVAIEEPIATSVITEGLTSEFTQTITTPESEQIEDFDIDEDVTEVAVETEKPEIPKKKRKENKQKEKKSKPKSKKKQDKENRNVVDIVLTVVIILLVLLIAYNVLSMV